MSSLSAELPLVNKNILLAVTGSVAACKADRIISELRDRGATVQVLLTPSGERFFPAETAGSLTSKPVLRDQFDTTEPGEMIHVDVKREHDLILVAPATANRLLQIESPEASDALGTILQAFEGPVLYAPAMNPDMWDEERLQTLIEEHSDKIISPDPGIMACGDEGTGRLKDPSKIAESVTRTLWPSALSGTQWVVSAGPTREPWDAIRYLSNRSSGKMGEAIARMGYHLGASVHLVTGARQFHYPDPGYNFVRVETTQDLMNEVEERLREDDGYIAAAAVSDYRPDRSEGKIKSGQSDIEIPLLENPDVLTELRDKFDDKTFVGFSADHTCDPNDAIEKANEKGLEAVVFNSIRQEEGGFSEDRNEACFCLPDGTTWKIGNRKKNSLALQLWLWLLHEDLI